MSGPGDVEAGVGEAPTDRARTGAEHPAGQALIAAALVAIGYLLLRTAPALAAGAFSDDGVYLSLGKALAEGEGYRSLYAVGEPVHMKYPPGLPALYAVLWTLRSDLGFVHGAAMTLSLLATAATAGVLWWIGRVRLALHPVVAAVLVVGPLFLEGSVQYFNLPISEPWFMLGWAICLLLAPRAMNRSVVWSLGLGITIAVTTLFRTQAVLLIPALMAALWVGKAGWRRILATSAAAVAPLVAWTFWHRARAAAGPLGSQPDEATYTSWAPGSVGETFAFLFEVARSQVIRYSTVLPPHVSGWTPLGALICLLVLVGLAFGFVTRFKENPTLVLSTLALTGVIGLWPYSQDRFVLALLPFVGLLAGAGAQWIAGVRRAPGARPGGWATTPARVLVGVLALVTVAVGVRQAQIRGLATEERTAETFYFHPAQFLPDNSQFVISASRWLTQNSAPADRLLTPLSSALWLYTGRKGVNATPAEPDVGPSVFDEPGRFLASRVLADDVNLLLLWNPNFLITRDGAEVQQQCPDALEFLQMTEPPARVAVFRIHKNDPCFQTRFLDRVQ